MPTGILTEEWMQGSVGFEMTDLNIKSIFVKRGVEYGVDAEVLTEKQQDLCVADACVIFLLSSNKGGVKEQDGNSSRTSASESFTYRENAEKMAIFLYSKWGETIPDLTADNVYNKSDMW